MILEGSTITASYEEMTPAALTITQLLKFNSIKHRNYHWSSLCMSQCCSGVTSSHLCRTDVTLWKKDLVDRLYHLGLSIYPMTVFFISQHKHRIRVCKKFHNDHVVCHPRLRGSIFTTSAADNIDYNPSSTASNESFHGTGISLFQHLMFDSEGVEWNVTTGAMLQSSKSVDNVPCFYIDVSRVTYSIKKSFVSTRTVPIQIWYRYRYRYDIGIDTGMISVRL